jgi:flagellar motor switch protein FliM
VNLNLSQSELDVLMAAAASRRPRGEGGGTQTAVYDFRRPDRVSKDQLRSLHFLHDRFAVNVSTSLSAFLRAMTEVNIVSVEQFAYSKFLTSLPDPTAFYAIGMPPLEGLGAVEINPSIAFTMVDRMLGGTGQTAPPNRALSEIEQNVLDAVVKLLLDHLTESWRAILDVKFRIQGRETRPQILQITGQNEIVIVMTFEIHLGDVRGLLRVCIPASTIETMEEKVAPGWHRRRREPTATEQARLFSNLGRVPLQVNALLETRFETRELLALRPGDVIALGHSASNPVDIRIGRVRRFTGRLTTRDTGAAILIEQVSSADANAAGGGQ